MSKVYSLRLNDDNPREAQAREAIEAWVRKGHSLRYVVIEALINLKNQRKDTKEIDDILRQHGHIVENSIGKTRQ